MHETVAILPFTLYGMDGNFTFHTFYC